MIVPLFIAVMFLERRMQLDASVSTRRLASEPCSMPWPAAPRLVPLG